ncbi:vitronectin a [Diretmus argenteus]
MPSGNHKGLLSLTHHVLDVIWKRMMRIHTHMSHQSCMARCENGFDSQKTCQCDSMCKYYKSCCLDYEIVCRRNIPVTQAPSFATTAPVRAATTEAPDPDAEICSGKPFDSFMQLKNGSIYAFRGKHFFELGQKSVVPGYPKLIKDVWGISGPIDAAFTRVNCQGKTYIFKGSKYWRFDNGVLDDDYPRDISVGFHNIPDHVDAAFALPALSHHGKEKVYFFKGDQYYLYEFMHQPSHGECITMSESSPSTLFRRYTDMSYYESFFSKLFSDMYHHHSGHHFIDKDWHGIKSPVDAVLAGRIYVAPLSPTPDPSDSRPNQQEDQQQGQQWNQQSRQYEQQWNQQSQQYGQQWNQQSQQYGQQWNQQYGQQGGRRRQNRSPSWESIAERGMSMGQGMDMGQGSAERGMDMGLRLAEKRMEMEERFQQAWNRGWDQDWDQHRRRDGNQQYNSGNDDSRSNRRDDGAREFIHRSQPLQSVYFFKGDKYFRVDLRTKRVDTTIPPYPRSIAKYWLGCSDTRAEKK